MADIETCFWCLKPKDKSIKFDKSKDTMIFSSYMPCKECIELFSTAYQIIGVQKEPIMKGQVPMLRDNNDEPLYPTGQMFLAPKEWVMSFLSEESDLPILQKVLKYKVMFLPADVVVSIINDMDKQSDSVVPDDLVEKQLNGKIISNSTDNLPI